MSVGLVFDSYRTLRYVIYSDELMNFIHFSG